MSKLSPTLRKALIDILNRYGYVVSEMGSGGTTTRVPLVEELNTLIAKREKEAVEGFARLCDNKYLDGYVSGDVEEYLKDK